MMQPLDYFATKRVLVTGASGLIGREVVRLLKEIDCDVFASSYEQGHDLTNSELCKELIKDFDAVFHVAGIKGSAEVTKKKPASFFVPLMQMNTNVLEACRQAEVEKVVYVSSIGAYSPAEILQEEAYTDALPPMDFYPGWAKRMAETQIKAYNIQYGLDNFAIVRPCNVYGPWDNFDPNNAMVIPSLMARIKMGENPLKVWGSGKAIRDFAYCTDVAMGIIRACFYGTRGSFINLGSGDGVAIWKLVETLAEITPFDYEFDSTREEGYSCRVMDIERAKNWIGYEPKTSLEDGLRQTWEWFIANDKEYLKRKNYFVDDNTRAFG